MEISHELEKLDALRQKGVLTREEFDVQKKALLAAQIGAVGSSGQKQQLIYVLLAFFLGALGIHNFYAGYKGRGVTQLLLTVFSPLTLFLSLICVEIWVIINIFRIKKDAAGEDFLPSRGVQLALGWIKIVFDILAFGGILLIAGIAGYAAAMQRFQANAVLDYATHVAVMNQKRSADFPVPCRSLVPETPSALDDAVCMILHDEDGVVVLMQGVASHIMEQISVLAPGQTVIDDDVIGIQF